MWTGLGITSLIQAGIASIATSTAQYRFWTEDYPNPPIFEGPAVHPGDVVYVYVEYLGSNSAYYYLENETSGNYQSFVNSAPYVGWRAANYINERVQGYYLPNFGSVGIAGNSFGTDTDTWSLTGALNQAWVMTSNCLSTGNGLSVPSTVQSDSSFYQHWYQGSPFIDVC
jgi:hypothetical protein